MERNDGDRDHCVCLRVARVWGSILLRKALPCTPQKSIEVESSCGKPLFKMNYSRNQQFALNSDRLLPSPNVNLAARRQGKFHRKSRTVTLASSCFPLVSKSKALTKLVAHSSAHQNPPSNLNLENADICGFPHEMQRHRFGMRLASSFSGSARARIPKKSITLIAQLQRLINQEN